MGIERLETSAFKASSPVYVDAFKLHELYDGVAFRAPLVLVGPKGIGKTLSVQSYAVKKDVPIITFDCSEDVRRSHLLGSYVLRGSETPFVLGPVTTAFEVANEVGHCILCFEELNALTPQMQKILNAVSDFRRRVEVPECKTVFRLKDGAKLWIAGTMNTAVYGGVYTLNEDLKSRFRMLQLEYPTPTEEEKIVLAAVNGAAGQVPKKVVDQAILLAHETRQQSLEYALSTRDVVQLVEDFAYVGAERALQLVLGKFEGDDRATVKQRMMSVFEGVTL